MRVDRGEVWIVDLGYAAKTRPCLVISVAPDDDDRDLRTLIPFTTQRRGTRFEVPLDAPFLATRGGVVDAQNMVTVPSPKFVRNLGRVSPDQMAEVERAVRSWLGF